MNKVKTLGYDRWLYKQPRQEPGVRFSKDPKTSRARRAFLKRPENFSGPKTFRGSFWVNFSGPEKPFSTRPKTPRILTRVFRVVFSGLQRELESDLLRT